MAKNVKTSKTVRAMRFVNPQNAYDNASTILLGGYSLSPNARAFYIRMATQAEVQGAIVPGNVVK